MKRPSPLPFVIVVAVLLLISARTIAVTVIDYEWWQEMGQLQVWLDMLFYGVAPIGAASVVAFGILWMALARGLKQSGSGLSKMPAVAYLGTFGVLVLGVMIASGTIDSWTVMRYIGARSMVPVANAWVDPAFNQPLSFYLFELPFYGLLQSYVLVLSLFAAIVYWVAARAAQLRDGLSQANRSGEIDISALRLGGGLDSLFLRGAAVVFFLSLALKFYLGRYAMLMNDHGFMTGVDYVDEHYRLPLVWVLVGLSLAAPVFVMLRAWKVLVVLAAVWVLQGVVPGAVSSFYVKPNEIALQKPYIERHLKATRDAYGLSEKVREQELSTSRTARIDPSKHKALFDNIRLWDWRAFHDTVTQIQALRPYYVFKDTDVDRYMIDGELRQVMVTPREVDIRQVPDAQTRWSSPHFIYTHGYGMVMAEASRITKDGLPRTFVQDAPVKVLTNSLKLTRPEIYFGEVTHEPVFVKTAEQEFSYPEGDKGVFTRYSGPGGIPIGSFGMRLAAALREGDFNILLTSILTSESKMLIRRKIGERLETLAGFITWDEDPYLVLTDEGRLVWLADGYTTSDAHPYSRQIGLSSRPINYIRNSVKASIDAYTGETIIYVFEPKDPVIQAYWKLFPSLMKPASNMPPYLRTHARYPETIFRVQAEIYRTYHMRDAQAFYNKEDLWDVARNVYGSTSKPEPVTPSYVVAAMPGDTEAEFMLTLPFTPRGKDNLTGLMVARSDGDRLGELDFYRLSKQQFADGPMQVESRISSDQVISKDLTLWNQQGSEVLRGQLLTLPVENALLYVEPIYIQASQSRMPQLKKVVLALGDLLIYRDTYEEALAELAAAHGGSLPFSAPATTPTTATSAVATAAPKAGDDPRFGQVREHMRKFREMSAQGKWAEAGKELEAIEALTKR